MNKCYPTFEVSWLEHHELIKARRVLVSGEERYLCLALAAVCSTQYDTLIEKIETSLEGYTSLDEYFGPTVYPLDRAEQGFRRIQWIDHLLAFNGYLVYPAR